MTSGETSDALAFLMTDVVGSTALWELHGDDMADALEIHDGIVHGAVAEAGGRVFKHTGDGMIAVFDDADSAVDAALQALSGLGVADWPATGRLDIRSSLHAGRPSQRDGDFFGPPLNRTARINGVGQPNQILASDELTTTLSRHDGTDLGLHQLRDLTEPIRLWQLDQAVHPELRTLRAARHNLPVMPTEFIGRQRELDDLKALVSRNRLVTITGVGGCGKTRLALELAAATSDRFDGGVWFVDLSSEHDHANIGDRAHRALGLHPTGAVDDVALLAEASRDEPTLLIFDNCEHLIDDVADYVEAVLAAAPDITILATSREALSVNGERVWRIPNLHEAAVELFVDRASAAGVTDLDQWFDEIEDICRHLDDIPLAIELAAGQLSSLALPELSRRLDDRFSLLGGGRRSGRRRQRQQTLQTMMEWSYGLLTPEEAALLNQLAVFPSSFSADAVEQVTVPGGPRSFDLLQSLVAQSLVTMSPSSGRYRLLETVRLYALDQLLLADALATCRDRHVDWVTRTCGLDRLLTIEPGEGRDLEDLRQLEIDNIVAAMEWAETSGDDATVRAIFLGATSVWMSNVSLGPIALEWLGRVPMDGASDVLQATWLTASGLIHYNLGDIDTAFRDMVAASAMADDDLTDGSAGWWLHHASHFFTGMVHAAVGDFPASLEIADRIEMVEDTDPTGYAPWFVAILRADVGSRQDDPDALAQAGRALELGESVSHFAADTARVLYSMELQRHGRFREAVAEASKALDASAIPHQVRIGTLAIAVRALVALDELDAARSIIDTDFGPLLDAQRRTLRGRRLLCCATILDVIDPSRDLTPLASAALREESDAQSDAYIRRDWTELIGEQSMLAVDSATDRPAEELLTDALAIIDEHLSRTVVTP